MAPLAVLLAVVLLWLGHLVLERILLERYRRAVPLRISVTGTRGKTTVTRMLAAVLRESGRTVLAKTTGSEAAYILPDGSEEAIRRRGRPSVIEQKRLLRRAVALRADAVVAEVMSIHPENHRVEADVLLRPARVLVTNFRVDHVEAQGVTRGAVASVLALDVPSGARAFVPDAEWQPEFAEHVAERGGSVERVPTGAGMPPTGLGQFAENLDLVFAAARALGISDDTIRSGIRGSRGDLGALGVWRYPRPGGREPWLVVNAFAANDPESTLPILDRVLSRHGLDAGDCVGLLSLRSDRGDRTVQWIEALKAGSLARFRRLYVSGLHARAVRYHLRHTAGADRMRVLPRTRPQTLMGRILDREGDAAGLLFGFGNIGGLGEGLVRHWRETGESCGI